MLGDMEYILDNVVYDFSFESSYSYYYCLYVFILKIFL